MHRPTTEPQHHPYRRLSQSLGDGRRQSQPREPGSAAAAALACAVTRPPAPPPGPVPQGETMYLVHGTRECGLDADAVRARLEALGRPWPVSPEGLLAALHEAGARLFIPRAGN